jgi:hypothetical protein
MTFAKDPRYLVRPMGGRPCLPADERKVLISAHITPQQKAWLVQVSAIEGITLSDLIRRGLSKLMMVYSAEAQAEAAAACPDTCGTDSFD